MIVGLKQLFLSLKLKSFILVLVYILVVCVLKDFLFSLLSKITIIFLRAVFTIYFKNMYTFIDTSFTIFTKIYFKQFAKDCFFQL